MTSPELRGLTWLENVESREEARAVIGQGATLKQPLAASSGAGLSGKQRKLG